MLIISFLLAVALPAAAIWRTKEVPKSISSLVYLFSGNRRWLWTLWLWAVAFTLAPSLIDALSETWQFVGFLTILCLVATGAMPLFVKEKRKWHNVFGISAGVLSQVCVLIAFPWWLLLWLVYMQFVMGAFASFNDTKGGPVFLDRKGVLVAEAISALTTYFSLMCVV